MSLAERFRKQFNDLDKLCFASRDVAGACRLPTTTTPAAVVKLFTNGCCEGEGECCDEDEVVAVVAGSSK